MNLEEIKIYTLEEKKESIKDLIKYINELLEILSPDAGRVELERLEKLAESPFLDIFFLEKDSRVVGMASLHYMETLAKRSAWIEDVAVHPEYQGKGLGKRIMNHVIEYARKKGVRHIDLTSAPHRVAANRLYQKLKFEPRKTNVYRLKLKK